MKARLIKFGEIEIDGEVYENDVVIDRGKVKPRKKKASKPYRERYGHTPLSADEPIPWDCERLIVGTGVYGRLPIMDAVYEQAAARGVQLEVCHTEEACALLSQVKRKEKVNAILHVTC
ncbi:MAG: MTH938/NDUFAF3 family protein [Anaerolineae bacterium]|nr:MTH938/NDUFAF3 family protein [Anaerolineae bacterium]